VTRCVAGLSDAVGQEPSVTDVGYRVSSSLMFAHRIIVAFLSMASLQAAAALVADPSSASDVLMIVKQVADERPMARDDFYTQVELLRRFGTLPKIEVDKPDGVARHASVVGYGSLAEVPAKPAWLNGIHIEFGRYPENTTTPTAAVVCYMRATFYGFASGMDFENVVARLGPGWRRDYAAENRHFMAQTSEPFNPPFPIATAAMGNAIIDYGQGAHQLQLEFTSAGILFSAETPRLRC